MLRACSRLNESLRPNAEEVAERALLPSEVAGTQRSVSDEPEAIVAMLLSHDLPIAHAFWDASRLVGRVRNTILFSVWAVATGCERPSTCALLWGRRAISLAYRCALQPGRQMS